MRNFGILVDGIHNLVPFFLGSTPERFFKVTLLRRIGGRLSIFCFKRFIQCLGNGFAVSLAIPYTLFAVPAELRCFQCITHLYRRLAIKGNL